MIRIETKKAGIQNYLNSLVSKSNDLSSFLNKNVLAEYRNLQRKRWMTENDSETGQWPALSGKYAKWKAVKFAIYPGRGRKMLVATNTLFKSVIGPGDGFRKVVTPRSITISTSVPYAQYVDEDRTFTTWSRESIDGLRKMVADYVFKGRVRAFTNG